VIPDLFDRDDALRRLYGPQLVGIDEAGRGPWAGPVVSAAVILPSALRIEGLNDSKLLSPRQREELYGFITREAEGWAVGVVDHEVIDRINILQATYESMRAAFSKLTVKPDIVVVDGRLIPRFPARQVAFAKADRLSASVAAASIIAKVTRDRMMMEAHAEHPGYGFDRHKGYGTPEHMEALRRHGPCRIHRKSFAPVRALLPTR
jgi:ribonuclease HII